jgi:citrate synthase
MADEQTEREDGGGVATANETLSVTDNRTGESYDVEVSDGTVKAMDFR